MGVSRCRGEASIQTGEVREVSSVEVPSELCVVDKKVSAR